jgi:hypothetical protein
MFLLENLTIFSLLSFLLTHSQFIKIRFSLDSHFKPSVILSLCSVYFLTKFKWKFTKFSHIFLTFLLNFILSILTLIFLIKFQSISQIIKVDTQKMTHNILTWKNYHENVRLKWEFVQKVKKLFKTFKWEFKKILGSFSVDNSIILNNFFTYCTNSHFSLTSPRKFFQKIPPHFPHNPHKIIKFM